MHGYAGSDSTHMTDNNHIKSDPLLFFRHAFELNNRQSQISRNPSVQSVV
jgi:hypothetical protein